ncbi:PKD domain-containing protein [Candidatus Bathyarchaeota archaeon]|nr:PKD domain-containing protein [Candidatus Bathyarchaeota archaeon]
MKTLNIIYCSRIGFGILAALLAAVVVDLKVGTPLINGISVALAVYLVTYYVIKWRFMNKVDKPTKLFTMGIGVYFLTFILCWVLFITPFLAAPIATFTVDKQNPVVGEAITFDAGASEDPDGNIVKWVWNFGDEATIEKEIPKVTHSYSTASDYIVSLTVVDDNGISSFTSITLTVVAPS